MKKFIFIILSTSFILALSGMVGFCVYDNIAFAQTGSAPQTWTEGISPSRGWSDLIKVARNVFNILLYLFSAAAVLMIIWGGILYITSGGNKEKTELAKKVITYAIIGILVVVMSLGMINLTANLIAS